MQAISQPHGTLNIPISEGGIYSSHMYNLAKSQNYRGLKLLLSDTKFMTTIRSVLIHHKFPRKLVHVYN